MAMYSAKCKLSEMIRKMCTAFEGGIKGLARKSEATPKQIRGLCSPEGDFNVLVISKIMVALNAAQQVISQIEEFLKEIHGRPCKLA